MPETTFEEAKRCPKCQKPGDDRKVVNAPRSLPKGTKIHHIYCVTTLCSWFDTCWMVQVNADGSIPPPKNHTGEAKIYQGFEGHDDQATRIVDSLKRQAEQQLIPGAEIRSPHA